MTANPLERRMTNALRSRRVQMISGDSEKPPMLQKYLFGKLQQETAKLESMGFEDKLMRRPKPNVRDRGMGGGHGYVRGGMDLVEDFEDEHEYRLKKRRRRPVGETRGEYGGNGRPRRRRKKMPRKEVEEEFGRRRVGK